MSDDPTESSINTFKILRVVPLDPLAISLDSQGWMVGSSLGALDKETRNGNGIVVRWNRVADAKFDGALGGEGSVILGG